MLPVFEGNNALLVLPGAVRGPGVVEEHLLHRRDHQPADRPGAGLPQGEGRQVASSWWAATTSSRRPPTRSSRPTRRPTASRSRARSTRRWATPTSPPSSTRSARRRRRGVQHPQRRLERRVLQGVHERRPDRRRRCRWSRCRSPRKRSPASARRTSTASRRPGTTTRRIDTPENKKFVAGTSRPSYGADQVTSDPMEAAYTSLYLWKNMVEKANSFDVPRRPGQRRRRDVRRAGGPGHHQRREPPHHQDRAASARSSADGLIYTIWESRRPDRARPVPQVLPLGQQPQRLSPWRSAGVIDRAEPESDCRLIRTGSHGSPGHPGVQRAEPRVDPAAGRARAGADVRSDGRHQHGARRVHHGRRLHRLRRQTVHRQRRRCRCSISLPSRSSSPACSACCWRSR